MAVSQSDQYEILAARVAQVQSQDRRIQSFAAQMMRDHAKTGEELRQAATASGLQPPNPGMSSDQAALLASLQSLRGRDFDNAYAHQQMLAHTQAIAVEETFAESGSDENLRKFARSTLPIIKDHLKMAQQLRGEIKSFR